MIIRRAELEDATQVAEIIFLAMEDILYQLIGKRDVAAAKALLLDLVKMPGNQYSYECCHVAELDGDVVAAVLVYDGATLTALRAPVIQLIKDRFGRDFSLEPETEPGEFYIDSLGVSPALQGRQIGSKLLQYLFEEYADRGKVLGLLVDKQNPGAKKLYLKLGFTAVGEKLLAGKQMEHLQKKRNS